MKRGHFTYDETTKDDGSIVYRATYHLSDEEKELIDSLTEEERERLRKEIEQQVNINYQRAAYRMYDELEHRLLFG